MQKTSGKNQGDIDWSETGSPEYHFPCLINNVSSQNWTFFHSFLQLIFSKYPAGS